MLPCLLLKGSSMWFLKVHVKEWEFVLHLMILSVISVGVWKLQLGILFLKLKLYSTTVWTVKKYKMRCFIVLLLLFFAFFFFSFGNLVHSGVLTGSRQEVIYKAGKHPADCATSLVLIKYLIIYLSPICTKAFSFLFCKFI